MANIVIVDDNDQVIGHKKRADVQSQDIYRVSALWIQNSQGEILLAQRSFKKNNHPGYWGPAVAGTVEEGETYESNIIKETEEEIGLKNVSFKKLSREKRDGEHKHFTQWFFAIIDKKIEEFTIQEEEVERIKWFTKEELLQAMEEPDSKFLKASILQVIDYVKENSPL